MPDQSSVAGRRSYSQSQGKSSSNDEAAYPEAVNLLAAWIIEHADAVAKPFCVKPASVLGDALARIRSDAPLFGLGDAEAEGSGNRWCGD